MLGNINWYCYFLFITFKVCFNDFICYYFVFNFLVAVSFVFVLHKFHMFVSCWTMFITIFIRWENSEASFYGSHTNQSENSDLVTCVVCTCDKSTEIHSLCSYNYLFCFIQARLNRQWIWTTYNSHEMR